MPYAAVCVCSLYMHVWSVYCRSISTTSSILRRSGDGNVNHARSSDRDCMDDIGL
jgi:hypothetical protein